GQLEVVEYERGTAAYGWAGSWIEVHQNGELLDELPVFSHDWLPGGGSIRSFIEDMFGGPAGPRGGDYYPLARPGRSPPRTALDPEREALPRLPRRHAGSRSRRDVFAERPGRTALAPRADPA